MTEFFFGWVICHAVGYKSRADENSWNGASRKVLDSELATHLAMYQSIPEIYTRVEKLGVCLCLFVCVLIIPSVRFASLPAFDLQRLCKMQRSRMIEFFLLVETCVDVCWIMRQKSSMVVVLLCMMFLTLLCRRQNH